MCDGSHAEELKRLILERDGIINRQQKLIKRLAKQNERLAKQNRELEKMLKLYESPHIPSSKRIIRVVKKVREPKKRGAPNGHKGATRKPPVPDRIAYQVPVECPRCESNEIKIWKEHKKLVEDIEVTKVVTEQHFYECSCEDCGMQFMTSSEDLPKQGNFGPNITSLWTMLHYEGTIPFDRLSAISRNCFDMDITPAGIHNAIYRTAGIFEPYYNRIESRLIKSRYVRSDETKYPFNGEKYWLWNISNAKDTLVKIVKSRGSRVLKGIFGDFLDAVLNSDCFSAYDKYKAREYQKDWAHVLNDAKDLAKHSREGEELHSMLLQMFEYIKKAKKEKQENTPRVERWKRRQERKILSWVGKNYKSKAVLNLVLRMSKYLDHWFTCLKYPFVEPTNNGSEREIRKNVIARKISGQHRSELRKHSREIMMSAVITMKKRRRNPFEFVRNGIIKYNLKQNLRPN